MKRYIILAVVVGILIASGYAMAKDSSTKQLNGQKSTLNVPTLIPGHLFAGDYIRIGINNGGTLGVTGTAKNDPGVGFQSRYDTPFSSVRSTESIAINSWIEGYVIGYTTSLANKKAYWHPDIGLFSGQPPAASNIAIVSNTILANDGNRSIKKTIVKTKDNKLRLNFTWTFYKRYPEVSLETIITNIGSETLKNVVYKRTADINVCGSGGNNWTSSADSAYAWTYCSGLDGERDQITMSGRDGINAPVSYVDLDSWEDFKLTTPGFSTIQSESLPLLGDYAPSLYYNIGDLKSKQSKTVYTVYQTNMRKYFPPVK